MIDEGVHLRGFRSGELVERGSCKPFHSDGLPPEARPSLAINTKLNNIGHSGLAGALSIKCAVRGQESYVVNGRKLRVDGQTYLILNHGQEYDSIIQSEDIVESFIVFFAPDLVDAVYRCVTTSADLKLDYPHDDCKQPLQFAEHLHRHDSRISPLLTTLRQSVLNGSRSVLGLQEQFFTLLETVIARHRNADPALSDHSHKVGQSVKAEMRRRLAIARDYMESNFERRLSLQEIANVAYYNPHHFLRMFRQTFGVTPYRYISNKRIARARELLEHSGLSTAQICYAVGFESVGSFGSLFRSKTGMSPGRYRSFVSSKTLWQGFGSMGGQDGRAE